MDIGSLEASQTHQLKIVARHLLSILVGKMRFHLQAEENVAQDVEPREERCLLKHHQALTSRLQDPQTIGRDGAAVRLF